MLDAGVSVLVALRVRMAPDVPARTGLQIEPDRAPVDGNLVEATDVAILCMNSFDPRHNRFAARKRVYGLPPIFSARYRTRAAGDYQRADRDASWS